MLNRDQAENQTTDTSPSKTVPFVTANMSSLSAIENLANVASDHARVCISAELKVNDLYLRGHAAVCEVSCKKCRSQLGNWPSSSYLPNGNFL